MKDPKDVLDELREWLDGAGEETPFFMKEIDIDYVRRAAEEIERLRREREERPGGRHSQGNGGSHANDD
jgi:hypothetical protein